MAIQDGVVKMRNYLKYIVKDSSITDDTCRLCGKQSETIQHIISSCEKLVVTEYKERHDSVAKVLHSALTKKSGLRPETTPYWK